MAYPVLFFYSMHLLKVCALFSCAFNICKIVVAVDNCILSET